MPVAIPARISLRLLPGERIRVQGRVIRAILAPTLHCCRVCTSDDVPGHEAREE